MYEKDIFGSGTFEDKIPGAGQIGVRLAKIIDIKDPKNLGRVKCQFFTEDNEGKIFKSDWAYVVTPFGGNDHGIFFHPNVGDIVLLAFEGGDIYSPYVIGSVWWKNDQNQIEPPAKLTGNNEKNNDYLIKTPKGNSIKLSDTDKKENIEIKTKAGSMLSIDEGEGKIQLKSSGSKAAIIIDTKKSEMSIKCNKLEITTGSNKLTMDSSGLKIDCKPTTSIKATTLTLEGTGTADLKGGVVNVKSNGIATVKGTMLKLN